MISINKEPALILQPLCHLSPLSSILDPRLAQIQGSPKSREPTMKYWVALMVICCVFGYAQSHNEGESGFHCHADVNAQIQAEYRPGIITVDGKSKDWDHIIGYTFPLLPALDPDEENRYTDGDMNVKALHDGQNIFFLLEVKGKYRYEAGKQTSCPSVALMFQVGHDATYHNMGGCKESPQSCSSRSCSGHEVDIMHFSIGTAIPGRLYGANIIDNGNGTGGDRFGHLVDLYAWTPHCRYVDGIGPQGNGDGINSSAQNDWKGAWWHDSINNSLGLLETDSPYASSGDTGIYSFELMRPLRTSDRLQQDVQFVIGQTHMLAAAFWYPVNGQPWIGSSHYSVNCDWVPLDIIPAENERPAAPSRRSFNVLNAFSLLLSVAAFGVSLHIGWWIRKNKAVSFAPVNNL